MSDRAKELGTKNAAQAKLFEQLVNNINKEFQKNGDKLVKQYGNSSMKKIALETLNNTVNSEVNSKLEEVKSKDPKEIKEKFHSIATTISKESKRVDTVLKGVGSVLQSTPLPDSPVFRSIQETIDKCQKLIQKYTESLENLETVNTPSTWKDKIKKMICCGNQ